MGRSALTLWPYLWSWGKQHQEVTEGYPDQVSSRSPEDLPARSRGLLFNDIDRCTGCGACARICPTRCIQVEQEELGQTQHKKWVSVFDLDFTRCMFCGLCVEVCLPGSLSHSRQFEGAAYQTADLIASFGRGARLVDLRLSSFSDYSESGTGTSNLEQLWDPIQPPMRTDVPDSPDWPEEDGDDPGGAL